MIGHWAQDGKLHPESHCSEKHHNVFVYQSADNLLKDIITTFTFDGQVVVDAVETSGVALTIYVKEYKFVHLIKLMQ